MFSVICISHTDGSGGEAVGRMVADRLGYRYVNEQLILEAARLAQVDPALVAAAEQKQSFMQKILDAFSSAQESLGSATLAAGFAVPVATAPGFRRSSKEDLRSMIRAAIHEVGKDGNSVIVAHAASMALAKKPGVLRVLVTASQEARRRRIVEERGISEEAADEQIAEGDENRRDYLRTFYDIDEELPTHYDLVLSTDCLVPEQVAEMVVGASRV
jgi:cytidylate kinase